MKFIVLLIFVVIACGENLNNFDDFSKEKLILDAACRSFCKHKGLTTCVVNNCTCKGNNFNIADFKNVSFDSRLIKPHLRCKEDDLISVVWETEEDFAYFLEVTTEQERRFLYNVTVCNFYTIKDLPDDTIYKIHLWSVSYSKKEVLCSDVLEVKSSKKDFVPSPVEYMTVENLTLTEAREEDPSYKAVVTWKPNEDYSCRYDITIWSNNEEMPNTYYLNVISDSYQFQKEDLQFGMEYAVGIRASTTTQESDQIFFNISIPSCLSIYNGSMDNCVPEDPEGLIINESIVDVVEENSMYDINLSWSKPNWPPTYYNACITKVIPVITECITIDGNNTLVVFRRVEFFAEYHFDLQACSSKGCGHKDTFYHPNPSNIVPTNLIPISHLWRTLGLVLIAICTFAIIAIIITVMILIHRHRTKQGRQDKCFTELEEKVPETTNNLKIDLIIKQYPLADQWELDSNKVHFLSVLGEGAFGIVRRACLEIKEGNKLEVAIKMLKNSPSSEEVRQFTQEIEIMKSVRQHPYIVSLIGCITRGLPEGPLLVVEYCSRGDLQTYLRAAWDKFSNMQRDVIYMDNESNTSPNYFSNKTYDFHNINHGDEFIIQPKHLLSIARQVALGMEHLANMRVVHRDLAARNVLVCEDHTVKVSDFGLSRDVYQDNVYCKSGGGKLPIRWMALESLTHQRYTTKSDVWSFGILLWEIVTLGGTPYVGIHSCDLLDLLKRGYRLKCPATCNSDLYTIMENCWKVSPKDRPTFSELCKSLEILLENISEYLHVENEQTLSNNCNNLKSNQLSNGTCSYERYINPIGSAFK